MSVRIGNGYDSHRLVAGRPLILGGVEIATDLGLLGHSDGDALTHALMDALLGALALGDIGDYFPSSDPNWQDANSLTLLARIDREVRARGWRIGNLDATLVAERPKLGPHLPDMRDRLSQQLGIGRDRVSVKATTNDKLGHLGRGEGICAHAVALLVAAEGDRP